MRPTAQRAIRLLASGLMATALIATGLAASPSAAAHAVRRPDLAVSGGSVTSRADGIDLTATIANKRSFTRGAAARRTTLRAAARSGTVIRPLATAPVPGLRSGRGHRVGLHLRTDGLSSGPWAIEVCADATRRVRERRESNNCRTIGRVTVPAAATPPSGGTPNPLCGTPNCAPLALATDDEATYTDATGTYWAYVPSDLGTAPAAVLIWLHGCGGDHSDSWGAADYWGEHYIALLPDGAEGGCWDMTTGPDRVVAAVQSAVAHFDVDPKRIVIGGYSSGGDLAYRAAFLHADLFAGLLAMNTSPFRDNGTSASVAVQAAWKLPIYHLAHEQDETYPLATVEAEIGQLRDAGFPVIFDHRPGEHWSEPSAPDADDGTWWDFQHRVVKDHMGLGWTAP